MLQERKHVDLRNLMEMQDAGAMHYGTRDNHFLQVEDREEGQIPDAVDKGTAESCGGLL
jgi:hypothetical protein